MPREYFYGFIVSFIAGIALEEVSGFGTPLSILCVLLAFVIVAFCGQASSSKKVLLVSFILLGIALGVFRFDLFKKGQHDHVLDAFLGSVVTVSGVIVDEPDVREHYTNDVLEVANVRYGAKEYVLDRPVKMLVRSESFSALRYGDEVLMTGTIILPKNISSKDGTHSFDQRAYLAKDDIFYQMYFPKVRVTGSGQGDLLREKLFALKRQMTASLKSMIPEPEASLASGIVLGAKESLGDELIKKFRETGVAHIVVLSGYNIAVVAGVISRLGMWMPFVIRIGVSVAGIILFALMVGMDATVVRATVMAVIVIALRLVGREHDALRVLVLAGGGMIFLSPMTLLHDVSFQLSFSATLALIVLVPVIEKYFVWVPTTLVREVVVTTVATEVFVLPLLLYHMGSTSLIGVIANVFILPVIPLAMFLVSVLALGAWVPVFANIIALFTYGVLAYAITVVELLAKVPYASISGVSFPLSALAVAYVLIAFIVLRKRL